MRCQIQEKHRGDCLPWYIVTVRGKRSCSLGNGIRKCSVRRVCSKLSLGMLWKGTEVVLKQKPEAVSMSRLQCLTRNTRLAAGCWSGITHVTVVPLRRRTDTLEPLRH